jgi:ParB family chromosome partitioning protein
MPLQLEGYALLPDEDAPAAGAPLQIAIEAIDEDPDQPRQEFDAEALAELAATIRERGVRQPISVRPHPEQPGRWVLNFGARRLRATRLAGRSHVPAFVDHAVDSYDQVIENEQRQGLRPLELALFVQKRLALGENQAEVARRLGKSRQYVTMATALIDAPDWLLVAYREGRCRGLNELHELRRLAAEHGRRVEDWAADQASITRDRLAALRVELGQGSLAFRGAVIEATTQAICSPRAVPTTCQSPTRSARPPSSSRPMLRAQLDNTEVCIDGDRVPPQSGHVFVHAPGASDVTSVDASRLRLLGFSAD